MKKNKGKIKNAVSLVSNGLTFKSKLELFTYNKLIEAGIIDFKYEEKKFVLLEAFEFTNESYELKKDKSLVNASKNIRSITYLPDFTNIDDFNNGWVLECKGYPNDAFPLKWKWFKDHLVRNNYNVTLYKPNNQANVLKTIELIKNKYYV